MKILTKCPIFSTDHYTGVRVGTAMHQKIGRRLR